jgi:ABC-type nickel/cobalt efflux system permease component RcnA
VIADGAANSPIIRITAKMRADVRPGPFTYEDLNFPGRAGWKEIVIEAGKGASIERASQSNVDRSQGLTAYPQDPTIAPPQDVRASVEWSADAPVVAAAKQVTPAREKKALVIVPIDQPAAPPAPSPATLTAKNAPAGAVVRGDFLSRLLHRRELSLGMILAAIVVAFGLGAAHALTPGHGKTIVAAYLVGSRGTLKHAAFLGAMVTFTHTISVFLLGLATLFLFQFIVPEKITEILGVVSGLSIVAIGGWMLYKRLRGTRVHAHAHEPHHHHDHDHAHPHTHDHGHDHTHEHGHDHHHHDDHAHDHHHHHHGPGGHSHVPEGDITWGSLIALGASGGLVPCESALLLLLSAIALGRVALGLVLLISFSLGLAVVLMAIGVVVLYAKNLLPERSGAGRHPFFRWVPVASAAVVMCLGLLMTGVSLGWLRPGWLVG